MAGSEQDGVFKNKKKNDTGDIFLKSVKLASWQDPLMAL